MPGDPKCLETSIIPKVKYSERKISIYLARMRYIFWMHINITQKWVRLCHHAVSQAV